MPSGQPGWEGGAHNLSLNKLSEPEMWKMLSWHMQHILAEEHKWTELVSLMIAPKPTFTTLYWQSMISTKGHADLTLGLLHLCTGLLSSTPLLPVAMTACSSASTLCMRRSVQLWHLGGSHVAGCPWPRRHGNLAFVLVVSHPRSCYCWSSQIMCAMPELEELHAHLGHNGATHHVQRQRERGCIILESIPLEKYLWRRNHYKIIRKFRNSVSVIEINSKSLKFRICNRNQCPWEFFAVI